MSSFFPSYNVANMDFNDDDLVGLVSSERSTSKHGQHQLGSSHQSQSQMHGGTQPHNIFDISAPAYTHPTHQPPSYHFSPPTHFNSTIPPLSYNDGSEGRSRSRSRPPSIGPTRSRRGNSISSTSPPPGHNRPNPSHIMIPSSRPPNAASPPPSSALSAGGWYIPPTPDSIGNPHSLPQSQSYYDQEPPFPATFGSPPLSQSVQDKQTILANEKRRRRRESHNAVERRRRDNINEKITELATLIPEVLLEGATPNGSASAQQASSPPAPEEVWGGLLKGEEANGSPPPDIVPQGGPTAAQAAAGIIKANKGMILTKSVEYIRFLQQLVTAQGARNRELENELRGIRGEPLVTTYHSQHHQASSGAPFKFGSEFSGSPLGDVQEEEDDVKREDGGTSDSGEERGRRRHRNGDMDVDADA